MQHKRKTLIAPSFAVAVLLSPPGSAQEHGDVKRGSVLARSTCAVCHDLREGDNTGNPLAPPFKTISESKGMSAMALNVALLTPHHAMPNIMLDPQERADVIAYILSLKTE